MDGAPACLVALQMVHARLPSVFPQRCVTHAYNLLFKRFDTIFSAEMQGVPMLISWIVTHDKVFTIFKKAGALALLQPAVTRHAGKFLALLSVEKDKGFIKSLFENSECVSVYCPPLVISLCSAMNALPQRVLPWCYELGRLAAEITTPLFCRLKEWLEADPAGKSQKESFHKLYTQ